MTGYTMSRRRVAAGAGFLLLLTGYVAFVIAVALSVGGAP